ncbi:MAG: cation-translocating P-type ATPase [Flavobacterium sp.]|nr:MAG: cation-translocating P-type ATPase [Flavobacterium sp.]
MNKSNSATNENGDRGLTSVEAAARLKTFGTNEISKTGRKSLFQNAKEIFKEPMFFLLLCCALIYILIGNNREGIAMLFAVVMVIVVTRYQAQKTEQALQALAKIASPMAAVVRDGVVKKIAGRDLVPGDVIVVNEGDRVPADAVLLDGHVLTVDESLLTGESVPVFKSSDDGENSQIFGATLATSGHCRAVVTATGQKSRLGTIGNALTQINIGETRLQIEMKKLIKTLLIIGSILCVIIVIAFYLANHNFVAALLSGLAAAMALMPEEFSVVLTIFLALGALRLSKINVLVRKPASMQTLGSATVLCTDKTGTITQNIMEVGAMFTQNKIIKKEAFGINKASIQNLIATAVLASRSDTHDPMEIAIQQLSQKLGAGPGPHVIVREYPLSQKNFAMTQVAKLRDKTIANCKGAPEAVLAMCELSEDRIDEILESVKKMAASGLRVLAVANATPGATLPQDQQDLKYEFLGLLGFEDPIRAEVPAAVSECMDAGIKVIMITGDYPETAKAIALKIGLPSSTILTGNEIENLTDIQLTQVIRNINIFARVIPHHKLRIVQAFQANNEIVAMTGDGINDAPALKAADIGIAMGMKGTDVARESASLILTDDNFASIVNAIRSGRRIFDNLQKSMGYIVAIHIPIIILTVFPALFSSFPVLMLPLHIIFLELIVDPACSVVFEVEKEELFIMKKPPRNANKPFFGLEKIWINVVRGLFLSAFAISVYIICMKLKLPDGQIRACSFSALILGNIALIFSSLSKTRSVVSVIKGDNKALLAITAVALVLLWIILKIPALAKMFQFEFPGYYMLLQISVAAILFLGVLEIEKSIRGRYYKK